MKTKVLIVSVYLVATALYLFFLTGSYIDDLNVYLKGKTDNLKTAYDKIKETHSVPAKIFFDTSINKEEILSLYSKVKDADSLTQSQIRKDLYNKLIGSYNDITKYNYRQLHFHF